MAVIYSMAAAAAVRNEMVCESSGHDPSKLVSRALDALMPALDRCLQEAYHEGRMEGLEDGMEKGVRLGKLEVARRLTRMGMSADVAAELTGMREEDLHH